MTAVTPPDDAPVTFAAYAIRLGKSRPYVSSLKAKGTLHGPAFTVDGKIVPSIADVQIAAARDPARAPQGQAATTPSADTPYTSERTRKLAADRALSELDLDIRRGRYIERAIATPAIAGFFRAIRDGVILAIRENPDRPEDAATDFFAAKASELPNVLATGGPPHQPAS